MNKLASIELDLLLLYYIFADEFGNVDTKKASLWAKAHLGIDLPYCGYKILNQNHIDMLVEADLLPDISDILSKFTNVHHN